MKVKCPNCGVEMIYDKEEGAYVCPKCGLVKEVEELDYRSERKMGYSITDAMKRSRTGGPISPTKIAMGLTTTISPQNRDAKGMAIKGVSRALSKKIRTWHKRTTVSSTLDRSIQIAEPEFKRLFKYLNLPDALIEKAMIIFRQVMERGLIRGRLIETIVAAIVYLLCRQHGIPRTLSDIESAAEISKKEIGKTYKYIISQLKIKPRIQSPEIYLEYYAQRLNVEYEIKSEAKEILKKAIEKGLLSGRNPTALAAAVLYLAAKKKKSKSLHLKDLAQVSQVTEVTIKNRCSEIAKALGIKLRGL